MQPWENGGAQWAWRSLGSSAQPSCPGTKKVALKGKDLTAMGHVSLSPLPSGTCPDVSISANLKPLDRSAAGVGLDPVGPVHDMYCPPRI